MCVVSAVGDAWGRGFGERFPQINPTTTTIKLPPEVTKADFDALRQEVRELKRLLLAAKRFDEETGQADCEQDEKVALIKKVAELVGVDVSEVFGD